MSGRIFAIIDPAAGISGDMLLGALLDAGAPADWLTGLPGRLGLEGVTVAVEHVARCGIRCTKVTVLMADGTAEGPGDMGHGPADHIPHRHGTDEIHVHAHDGPHRHLKKAAVLTASTAPASGGQSATEKFKNFLLEPEPHSVHYGLTGL